MDEKHILVLHLVVAFGGCEGSRDAVGKRSVLRVDDLQRKNSSG
jgi:hypothetical protein